MQEDAIAPANLDRLVSRTPAACIRFADYFLSTLGTRESPPLRTEQNQSPANKFAATQAKSASANSRKSGNKARLAMTSD